MKTTRLFLLGDGMGPFATGVANEILMQCDGAKNMDEMGVWAGMYWVGVSVDLSQPKIIELADRAQASANL